MLVRVSGRDARKKCQVLKVSGFQWKSPNVACKSERKIIGAMRINNIVANMRKELPQAAAALVSDDRGEPDMPCN